MLRSSLWCVLLLAAPLMANECAPIGGESEEIELSQEQMERFGLHRNQLVRIAEQELYESIYSKRIALSDWLPHITYEAGVDHAEHKPFLGLPKDFYLNLFQVDQLVFSSDEFYTVRIATVEVQRQFVDLGSTQNDVLLELRRRYFQVMLDRANVLSARQNLHTLLQDLMQQREGVVIGTSTKLDVAQAEASYYAGMTSYYGTINELRRSENDFVETLGVSPDCPTIYVVPDEELPVMETGELKLLIAAADAYSQAEEQRYIETGELPTAWIEGCMPGAAKLISQREVERWTELGHRYRPAIITARLDVQETDLLVSQGKARYLPELGFFAQYQANPPDFNAFRFDESVWWNGGFTLKWNLFDGFGRENKLCRAKARMRAAVLNLERQIIVSDTEVRNQLNNLVAAAFEYAASVRGVEAAVLAVDLGAKARAIGLMTTLDYLETVDDLFAARVVRNQAAFDLLDAYYTLRFVVGTDIPLWHECGFVD